MTQIIPYIVCRDVRAAMTWLSAVLGFVEELCHETPNGGCHAEMTLDGQRIMLGQRADASASPAAGGLETMGVFIWAEAADAKFERAEAAGAQVLQRPTDHPYGRGFALRDPDGHPWYVTTPSA